MKSLPFVFAALVLVLPLQAAAQEAVPERYLSISRNTDFPGGDLRPLFDTTMEACRRACLSDPDCVAFTFNQSSNACFPKSEIVSREPYDGALSAEVHRTDPAVLSRLPGRIAGLGFLSSSDLSRARAQAVGLSNAFYAGGWSVDQLLVAAEAARDRNDPEGVARFTGAAITLNDAPELWVDYARALLATETENNQTRRDLTREGLNAAVNAALRAPEGPVFADALSILAEALERDGRGRDMIPALRLALAQGPDATLTAAIDRAIGLYGFRVVETQVENEAESPRICAVFSEPLAQGGVIHADFVQSLTSGISVEAEDRQLCIGGLSHGARYEFTLRAGLPAASGEVLQRPTSLAHYIRDRTPSVRFAGRAYILPASQGSAIPIVGVNTREVALRLHRVADRNIVRALQEQYFGRPLNEWELQGFASELAETVWDGTGEIMLEQNTDVTTRLPMGEILQGRAPGLYALEARPAELPEDRSTAAMQWFLISDLGISTLSGADGVHVFVRSLGDAGPRADVRVELVAEANRVLGEVTTDADGYAHFPAALAAGRDGAAPAMVSVTDGAGDFAFLSLREAEFDLSDRGVEGREAAGAIDLFLTTDRGAYRAGETVHATALARDARAGAITGLPLTAIMTRADGVEYTRLVPDSIGAGGYVFEVPLGAGVPRGTWRLAMHADPDAPPLGETRFLVEDFLPERVDLQLEAPQGPIRPDAVPVMQVQADYLFGAPAPDLPIEGEMILTATDSLEAYPLYRFGRHDDRPGPGFRSLPSGVSTDESGAARVALDLPEISGPPQPYTLSTRVRVTEGSGRPVEREIIRPVQPNGPLIGVRSLFDGALPEGGEAAFALIVAGDTGPIPARWTLNRVERRYQWYSQNGAWNWEPVTTRQRVATGDVMLNNQPVEIAAPVDWGSYELRVESTDGVYTITSVGFDAGWFAPADAGGSPDLLEVSLDAENYRPGDTAQLRIVPRTGGTALIRVMSNRLIDMQVVEIGDDPVEIALPVTDDWGSGAYVSATLIRPLGDGPAMSPTRALGLAHAAVDPGARALDVSLVAPTEAQPRGPLEVELRLADATPGASVYATIAAVDLGILNLTGFESPDPQGHYFGQRRLGMEIRDVYGRLIDGRSGAEGRVRSGGDGTAGLRMQAPPPTEELVAYFSGPLTLDDAGVARASFDIPAFNGTVRLMAVAWSDAGVGQAETDILVRDPVVVNASLPRFLSPGDSAEMVLDITHATGPTGQITLDLAASGLVELAQAQIQTTLGTGETRRITVPITAGPGVGLETLGIALTTPDGQRLERELAIPVQVNDPEVAETSRILLAPGETFSLDAAVFAGLRAGTGRATIAAGPLARFDVPGLLSMLDRYPYGCTEQVTSQALPLLYLSQVAEAMDLAHADDLAARVDDAIARVLENQSRNGGFGLWGASSGDLWLDAYVTDFLSRARAEGHGVPDIAFANAIDNLRNEVGFHPDFENGGEALAYALMVLAREGAASMGDLRYYADVKAGEFATPLALGQLGAALAMYGDQPRADAMFRAGYLALEAQRQSGETRGWRTDYGSNWRDAAGLLALAAAAGSEALPLEEIAATLETPGRRPSTQEAVWSLLAAHSLIDADPISDFRIDGQAVAGPLVEVLRAGDPTTRMITNAGTTPQPLRFTRFGVPDGATEAFGDGYRITRSYLTLEGAPADPANVTVGTRLVTVLTVTPFTDQGARLMVDDPLPAGFEIDNPNLLRGGDIRALDDLGLTDATRHTEFRQDRFVAAIDWRSERSFRLGYIVRAVSPGSFHHPAASVEDMYRPQFRAQTASGRVEVSR